MPVIDLWFKDAVIYCLDVDSYQDHNGDGAGDFHGLMDRLDHIAGLGATCVWLLPFYPSPDRDNGFDVMDYYGVDSRLGTLGDFVEFMHKAREHGLRLIIDLVVNHTSDQHPWFQSARQSRKSPYRDFYVWADEPPKDKKHKVAFPGEQKDVWTYDEAAGAYYFHHFYEHQPDLNIANPAVRDEICRIMGYWLELGVSGFRVDATPFLINQPGAAEALREFREFLSWRRGDAIMLAEANVLPKEMPEYFDDGIHMMFNFWVNQHLMLALVRKNATQLKKAFRDIPALPPAGQLANFLRNHDELDLGRLSEEERAEVFREFAPKEDMRIYGRGIRRRMPTMLGGDQARIRLAYSLMFSLPGTPVLRYGEEIGMGEDLSIPGRGSVRTAMQWSTETNGGFSTAAPKDLLRPAIDDGEFGYQQVNVIDQSLEPDSLLNWMEHLIRLRKKCPELGHGEFSILDSGEDHVFAHRCDWKNGSVIIAHNFSDQPAKWHPPQEEDVNLIELIGCESRRPFEREGPIELSGYGYRWFRVMGAGRKPA
jgi:maltose alpha-D-glucosyltransferase / alpha-amylase